MGGKNPYIKAADAPLPTRPYELTFLHTESGESHTVQIDPKKLPTSHTGLEGSILDIALALGIEIDHACGGVCACSTCHVKIIKGMESCNEALEAEEDQLDNAPGVGSKSRLACQAVPNGSCPVTVEIPRWNRNWAREGAH